MTNRKKIKIDLLNFQEHIRFKNTQGAYITTLRNADIGIFLDRTNQHTPKHRREMAGDNLDEFAEQVLEIEHGIITLQKEDADVIIGNDYNAVD